MTALALVASTAVRRVEPEWRRTGSRVWAHSRWPGEQRPTPMTRKLARRLEAALERHGKDTRGAAKRRGGKGTIGLYTEKIYAYLLDLAVRFKGEVYPSTAAIAAAVGCCARTVVKARAQLRDGKWLAWIRRCEPTGNEGRRGPQVRQISNWYQLGVGEAAARIFARWDARKPPPDDADQARRGAEAAFRQMCEEDELGETWKDRGAAWKSVAAGLRRPFTEREGA
jgi:hypothetical protein